MQHFSLSDLTIRIKRSIAINFPESIWVEAEVAQSSENRGHWYIDLIQKDEINDRPLAQVAAVIWRSAASKISKITGNLDEFLETGQQVLLEVDVDFHEVYGLKLIILNIDKNYTEGVLARQRAETIAELVEKGLWDKNRSLPVPEVIQRIAIISNENAAGYNDFIHQLNNNPYGYRFDLDLYSTAVQGSNARTEIPQQFKMIEGSAVPYDATVIIRGGGSKMDLSAFDDRNVLIALAQHRFPVITGIGHETDESLADLISAVRMKTPTAAAAYLIERMLHFENAIALKINAINKLISSTLFDHEHQLLKTGERINSAMMQNAIFYNERIAEKWNLIRSQMAWRIRQRSERLDHINMMLTELDPAKLLDKGYSILTYKGNWIKEAVAMPKDAELINYLKGGTIRSIYQEYEQEGE